MPLPLTRSQTYYTTYTFTSTSTPTRPPLPALTLTLTLTPPLIVGQMEHICIIPIYGHMAMHYTHIWSYADAFILVGQMEQRQVRCCGGHHRGGLNETFIETLPLALSSDLCSRVQ